LAASPERLEDRRLLTAEAPLGDALAPCASSSATDADAAPLGETVATASLVAAEQAAAAAVRMPSGNYLLRPGTGNLRITATALANQNIAGFVLRDNWLNVNPAPGVYDWSRIDAAVQQITAAGKQFKLTVFTGVQAPAWLYQQGARAMTFVENGPNRPSGTYTMPVPWDPVMLEHYGDLLEEMDRHFGSNPALVSVSLGGPTRYSLEMHLPQEVLALPDYSPAAIRGAWDTVFNKYAELFPNVPGVLHVSNPTTALDGIALQVALDAVNILGQRAILQHDALSAKPGLPTYNVHQLISQYGLSGINVGFEELSASNQERFGGGFDAAWQRLTQVKAKFLDLYAPDDALARAFPDYDHLGDMNYDGVVDNFDIRAFESALARPADYIAQGGNVDFSRRGDMNLDGVFDNFDIAAFEQLLTSHASTEPAPLALERTQAGATADWADLAFALAVEASRKRDAQK